MNLGGYKIKVRIKVSDNPHVQTPAAVTQLIQRQKDRRKQEKAERKAAAELAKQLRKQGLKADDAVGGRKTGAAAAAAPAARAAPPAEARPRQPPHKQQWQQLPKQQQPQQQHRRQAQQPHRHQQDDQQAKHQPDRPQDPQAMAAMTQQMGALLRQKLSERDAKRTAGAAPAATPTTASINGRANGIESSGVSVSSSATAGFVRGAASVYQDAAGGGAGSEGGASDAAWSQAESQATDSSAGDAVNGHLASAAAPARQRPVARGLHKQALIGAWLQQHAAAAGAGAGSEASEVLSAGGLSVPGTPPPVPSEWSGDSPDDVSGQELPRKPRSSRPPPGFEPRPEAPPGFEPKPAAQRANSAAQVQHSMEPPGIPIPIPIPIPVRPAACHAAQPGGSPQPPVVRQLPRAGSGAEQRLLQLERQAQQQLQQMLQQEPQTFGALCTQQEGARLQPPLHAASPGSGSDAGSSSGCDDELLELMMGAAEGALQLQQQEMKHGQVSEHGWQTAAAQKVPQPQSKDESIPALAAPCAAPAVTADQVQMSLLAQGPSTPKTTAHEHTTTPGLQQSTTAPQDPPAAQPKQLQPQHAPQPQPQGAPWPDLHIPSHLAPPPGLCPAPAAMGAAAQLPHDQTAFQPPVTLPGGASSGLFPMPKAANGLPLQPLFNHLPAAARLRPQFTPLQTLAHAQAPPPGLPPGTQQMRGTGVPPPPPAGALGGLAPCAVDRQLEAWSAAAPWLFAPPGVVLQPVPQGGGAPGVAPAANGLGMWVLVGQELVQGQELAQGQELVQGQQLVQGQELVQGQAGAASDDVMMQQQLMLIQQQIMQLPLPQCEAPELAQQRALLHQQRVVPAQRAQQLQAMIQQTQQQHQG